MSNSDENLFEVTRVRAYRGERERHRIGFNLKSPLGLLATAAIIGVVIGSGGEWERVDRNELRARPGSGNPTQVSLTPKPKTALSAEGAVHSGAGLSWDWCGGSGERRCKKKRD